MPSPPEHAYWRVVISVPPEDFDALRLAMPHAFPNERFALIREVVPSGEEANGTLTMDVFAMNREGAVADARLAYTHARDLAQLPPKNPAPVLGVITLALFEGPVYDRLWDDAHVLHGDGRHELAIVRAQTACECLAIDAIEGVVCARVGTRTSPLVDVILGVVRASLNDKRTQTLIRDLAGADWVVKQQSWWGDYRTHLQRRHAIVHRGLIVQRDDAEASLAAVDACMTWRRNLWAKG